MGASGVLPDHPERIAEWVEQFRAGSSGAFQLTIWIPDPPSHDQDRIDAARQFLERFGTAGSPDSGPAPVFHEQCEAMLTARPTVISSIMGLFDLDYGPSAA